MMMLFFCSSSIPTLLDGSHNVQPLPKCLFLQLDNLARDNKYQHVMAFPSMFTTQKIFQHIQVGFLLVDTLMKTYTYISYTCQDNSIYSKQETHLFFCDLMEISWNHCLFLLFLDSRCDVEELAGLKECMFYVLHGQQ